MADYSTNLETWGATGTAYPAGYSYLEGEQPVDDWDNFFAYNAVEDIKFLISAVNETVESSTGTTQPSDPDDGQLFWNTDDGIMQIYDGGSTSWETVAFDDDLTAHVSSTANPHSVTPAQIGAIADAAGTVSKSNLAFNPGVDVSDDDAQVVADTTDINFGSNLSVSDDTDGTVTVSAAGGTNTQVDVSEDGSALMTDVDDINFTGHLNVIDDGDGSVTVDPAHNHDSRYVGVGGGSMTGALDMGADILAGATTVFDHSADHVPTAVLETDSLTLSTGSGLEGGGSVALGGSLSISHGDTSTRGDISTSGGESISWLELDAYGHITDMSVQDFDNRYLENDQSVRMTVGTTAPTSPSTDDVWIDTN